MNFFPRKSLGEELSQKGAAALEYIIVSAFGVLLSLAAVAFLSKLAKDKFDKIGLKTGTSVENFDDFDS